VSKKPSLHDAKLRDIKAELGDTDADRAGDKLFRTSVLLYERQKIALDEERLRIRRTEGKSVSVTELMRKAIDEWLAKRGSGSFDEAADAFTEGMKRDKKRRR